MRRHFLLPVAHAPQGCIERVVGERPAEGTRRREDQVAHFRDRPNLLKDGDGLAREGDVMRPAHFRALGRNPPDRLFEVDLGALREANLSGAGEGQRRKLKRRLGGRPAVEAVDRTQEAAKRSLVRDRRAGLRIGAQERTVQGMGGVARRPQRDDRQTEDRADDAPHPMRGFATAALLDPLQKVEHLGGGDLGDSAAAIGRASSSRNQRFFLSVAGDAPLASSRSRYSTAMRPKVLLGGRFGDDAGRASFGRMDRSCGDLPLGVLARAREPRPERRSDTRLSRASAPCRDKSSAAAIVCCHWAAR